MFGEDLNSQRHGSKEAQPDLASVIAHLSYQSAKHS